MADQFALESSFCCFHVVFERLSPLKQVVFVYQRGMTTGGDVALDDITISPGGCYSEPISPPDDNQGNLSLIQNSNCQKLNFSSAYQFRNVKPAL